MSKYNRTLKRKYKSGGNFWSGVKDAGRLVADTGASLVGATDAIKDDMYEGKGWKKASKVGEVIGSTAGVIGAGAIGSLAGPAGAGIAMGAMGTLQGTASTLDGDPTTPKEINPYINNNRRDTTNQAYTATYSFANGGYQAMPGIQGLPNAEVENDEVIQEPNGNMEKINGNTHAQGGVDVNLKPGSRIFSEDLEVPADILDNFIL